MLETERLRVRPLSAGDAEAVRAVSGEPHPGWLEWTAATYGQLEALRQPPYGERAICLREGGELVGMVGVVPSMGPFAPATGLRRRDRAAPTVCVPRSGCTGRSRPSTAATATPPRRRGP